MRRTPDEARTLALASARRLLLAEGPDAVTLQAVASDPGMSHTNLIHHFGSAAGLQSELMRQMVSELTATIESAVTRLRAGQGELKDFVDIVCDAFDRGGAGRLAAWMALTGESMHLAPIGEVVRDYIDSVERGADGEGESAAIHDRATSATLFVTGAGRRHHRQRAAQDGGPGARGGAHADGRDAAGRARRAAEGERDLPTEGSACKGHLNTACTQQILRPSPARRYLP